MKAFMDENFILETETAQKLYHGYAAKVPIIAKESLIYPLIFSCCSTIS